MVQWIIAWLLRFPRPVTWSVQSLLMHFSFYIVNNIRQSNAIIHVDSIWSLAGWIPVFWGGVHVVQMEQLESNWTPHGLHMDSRQKIGWASTQKKLCKIHMDSGDWPGLHLDSTWNLWGRVKSSTYACIGLIVIPMLYLKSLLFWSSVSPVPVMFWSWLIPFSHI